MILGDRFKIKMIGRIREQNRIDTLADVGKGVKNFMSQKIGENGVYKLYWQQIEEAR